jgi:hypothetical protein
MSDFFDGLFERDRDPRRGRRSGFGGLLDRVFGDHRDDDDDDDRRERRGWDGRADDRDDDRAYGRRRRHDRDTEPFDFD